MAHTVRSERTWEARIYVGAVEGYDGPVFTEGVLLERIREYQRAAPENRRGCVRVTKTTYLFDKYIEGGWEIGIIQYPRFPLDVYDLKMFALALADHLLVSLKQNRVGVITPDLTYLLEAESAQEHPKSRTTEE